MFRCPFLFRTQTCPTSSVNVDYPLPFERSFIFHEGAALDDACLFFFGQVTLDNALRIQGDSTDRGLAEVRAHGSSCSPTSILMQRCNHRYILFLREGCEPFMISCAIKLEGRDSFSKDPPKACQRKNEYVATIGKNVGRHLLWPSKPDETVFPEYCSV